MTAETAAALGIAGTVSLYAAGWTVLDPFALDRSAVAGTAARVVAGAACFAAGAVLLFATIARAGVASGLPTVPLELGAIVAAAAVDALVGETLRGAAARAVKTACGPRRRRSARRTPPS